MVVKYAGDDETGVLEEEAALRFESLLDGGRDLSFWPSWGLVSLDLYCLRLVAPQNWDYFHPS